MRMRLLAVAAAAASLFAASPSRAGKGFTAARELQSLSFSSEPDARGGLEAFLRVRGDGTVRQGLRVWIQGLLREDGAVGATLWMANPGDLELEEVGEFAGYGGSGRFEAVSDTGRFADDALPLDAERMLDLLRAPVEVRVTDDDLDEETILFGQIPEFRYEAIGAGRRKGLSTRKGRLRRAGPPFEVVDESARGFVRLWRRREAGEVVSQGFTVFATGLTEDAEYEVWVEDEGGTLELAGETTSTAEGQAFYAVSDLESDFFEEELPLEIGDDMSLLFRRRVELRRSGEDDFSLQGTCPRVR